MSDDLPRPIVGIDLSINATGWATERPVIPDASEFNGGIIGPDYDYAGGVMRPRASHDLQRVVSIVNRLAIQIGELPQSLRPLAVISRRESKCVDTIHEEAILEGHLRCWLHMRVMPTILVPKRDLMKWLCPRRLTRPGSTGAELIWKRYRVEVQEWLHARAVGLVFIGKVFLSDRRPDTPDEAHIIRRLRQMHPDVCRVCGVKP